MTMAHTTLAQHHKAKTKHHTTKANDTRTIV